MPTHIGFLRAVNIGKRQYRSADLRAALTSAGYDDVDTYIQTGNVRISSPLRSRAKIEAELEALFLADRGFEVPTMVFASSELKAVAKEVAEIGFERPKGEGGHYLYLMKEEIPADLFAELEELTPDGISLISRGRVLHQLFDVSFGNAPHTPARAEKIMGIGTSRSGKVIREIVDRWC